MDRVARRGGQGGRPPAGPLPHAQAARARPREAGRRPGPAQHRLHQHDPARARARLPGRRARRAPDPGVRPLERRDDREPRQPAGDRRRRPHRHLRQRREPVRGRASTTSSRAATPRAAATRSSSRATRAPASTPARTSRAGSTETQLDGFRQESRPDGGLSSYPHPRLMPDFWEFPTVSMGLGPISAIYQARFNKYLHHRGIKDTSGQRVWCFLGDGEMDEPESLGAIGVAAREELDNLTFVVNCNLQRLDGPVRGNGKIMQELESSFRGAGWNVVKVVWGRQWDDLLAQDVDGAAAQRHELHAGRPVPDLLGRERRLHPREVLRHRPAAAQDGRAPVGRPDPRPAARRPRLPQGLRGLRRRDAHRRPADRDPGPHDQGLDARQGLRGPQRDPPDEEAHQVRAQGDARPALPRDPGQRARGRPAAVLPPGRGLRRDRVHARAAGRAGRRRPAPGRDEAVAARCRRRRRTTRCRRAPASSRSPPRWPSSACSRTS